MVTTATNRIVRDQQIWGGDPIIDGTRIPVAIVVLTFERTRSIDGVLDAYPHLDRVGVSQALAYYDANRDEIEQLILEHGMERD